MGLNLTIHCEPHVGGSSPVNDIRLIVTNMPELDTIATQKGVTTLSRMCDDSEQEIVDDDQLFPAEEGVKTFETLLKFLKEHPDENPESDDEYAEILIEELEEIRDCLRKAVQKKVRFCLLLV